MRIQHEQLMKQNIYPENLKLILLDITKSCISRSELEEMFENIPNCIPDHITSKMMELTTKALITQDIESVAKEYNIGMSYTHQLISKTLYGMKDSINFLIRYKVEGLYVPIHIVDGSLYHDLMFHSGVSVNKDTPILEVINKPLLGFTEDGFFRNKKIHFHYMKTYDNMEKHRRLRFILGKDHLFFERVHQAIQDRSTI